MKLAQARIAALRAQAHARRLEADALDAEADAIEATPVDCVAYYDQNTSPLSKRVYLRIARRPELQAKRVGKRVLVERAAFDSWLATQGSRADRTAPRIDPRNVDDEAANDLGLRLVRSAAR